MSKELLAHPRYLVIVASAIIALFAITINTRDSASAAARTDKAKGLTPGFSEALEAYQSTESISLQMKALKKAQESAKTFEDCEALETEMYKSTVRSVRVFALTCMHQRANGIVQKIAVTKYLLRTLPGWGSMGQADTFKSYLFKNFQDLNELSESLPADDFILAEMCVIPRKYAYIRGLPPLTKCRN